MFASLHEVPGTSFTVSSHPASSLVHKASSREYRGELWRLPDLGSSSDSAV